MAVAMQPVDSSNLHSVGYDDSTSTLTVQFNNGSVYEYYSVPASVWRGLMSASSKGEYFDEHVKKGGYRYKKIK